MKSKFVIRLLAVIVVFCSCHDSKAQKNDWEKEGLKGKVKMVKEIISIESERMGEWEKDTDKITYQIFNEKGNEIEENEYKLDGSLYNRAICKYDVKDNRIEMDFYNSENCFLEKFTYNYDDKGNMIEKNGYSFDDSLWSKIIYKYDLNGNNIEESNSKYKYIYKYDDKGNKTEYYNCLDSSFFTKTIYKYDEKGNYIEEIIYNLDGSIYSKYTFKYEYDSYGNWLKKIRYKGERKTLCLVTEREITYY
jgi:hypothetical protein